MFSFNHGKIFQGIDFVFECFLIHVLHASHLEFFFNIQGLHPPRTSGMGPASGFMSRMYPNSRMYGQFGSTVRTGAGFGSNGYDSRTSGRGWSVVDNKYKPRGRGNGFFVYGNESMDGLTELNRGPRAGRFKNQKAVAPNITIAVKGQSLPSNGNKEDSTVVPDRDQYNRAEFPINYSDAKFYIIKSYSEDDIHKSIKYSVWASTPNGNKKLDAGYSEAHDKTGGCPVFLFFSVSALFVMFLFILQRFGQLDGVLLWIVFPSCLELFSFTLFLTHSVCLYFFIF